MAEARNNIFDHTLGICSERQSWLGRKVLRRELTDDLNRDSLTKRTERASAAAEDFRDDMSRRAQLRNGIEKKSVEIRRREEEILKQKADEYRQRLQRYLPRELQDEA
jgi:hypothetical protein